MSIVTTTFVPNQDAGWEFVSEGPCWYQNCPGPAVTERKRVAFGVYNPEADGGTATVSGFDYKTVCTACGEGEYEPFDY